MEEPKRIRTAKSLSVLNKSIKECRKCKIKFYFSCKSDKECPNCIRHRAIKMSNERWLARKAPKKRERVKDPMAESFNTKQSREKDTLID